MFTSSSGSSELLWTRSAPQGRYDLVLNQQTIGWLQHSEYWNSESHAELARQAWVFRRPGTALGRTEILQGDDFSCPVGKYKSHWGGGGTLTLADGKKFLLSCAGVWHHVWSLVEEAGETVLRFEPRSRKVWLRNPNTLNVPGEERDRLLLLITFVWHEVLQAQDEAEIVAVMNATS